MKKIYIGEDELYPCWFLSDKDKYCSVEAEITEEEYEFIKKAQRDFDKAQELLRNKFQEKTNYEE